MINFIKAEELKGKRTFLIWLAVLAPIICAGMAAALMPGYFIASNYNWWNTIFLPTIVTFIPILMHGTDKKILGYGSTAYLYIDKKKFWLAKIVVACKYLLIATAVHFILSSIIYYMIPGTFQTMNYSILQLFAESFLLFLAFAWEMPFCFLLLKKFGMGVTIFVNEFAGILLAILFTEKCFWGICPYTYGTRISMEILGVLPNGLMMGLK